VLFMRKDASTARLVGAVQPGTAMTANSDVGKAVLALQLRF
jgi:hypothetical protein